MSVLWEKYCIVKDSNLLWRRQASELGGIWREYLKNYFQEGGGGVDNFEKVAAFCTCGS